MKRPRNIHIVFQERECREVPNYLTDSRRVLRVGVYIDLDKLAELASDAAKNKSKVAHDGPLYVEFHSEASR